MQDISLRQGEAQALSGPPPDAADSRVKEHAADAATLNRRK